jgi:hypothetical protein
MNIIKRAGLPGAAAVAREKLLAGFAFRTFRDGEVVCLGRASAPADPMKAGRLVPVATIDGGVHRAVAEAPETGGNPAGAAFVCASWAVGRTLLGWLMDAGAVECAA